MSTRILVVSHILIAAVGFGIGYALNDQHAFPAPDRPPTPSTTVDAATTNMKLLQATGQIASLQTELRRAEEDLEVAQQALETSSEERSGQRTQRTQTPRDKLATFRKLSRDPDVQNAMRDEQRKVMEDPATQNTRRAQMALEAKFYLEELASDLGLNDEQRDGLFSLWADGRTAEVDAMMKAQLEMSSDRLTQEQQMALQERISVVKEETRQKIADLLGSDFDAYESYSSTMRERAELNKMYSSGEPLDDFTKEAILLIMGEEQAAVGEPEPVYGMDMAAVLETQKDMLDRAIARDTNVIERATSYLTKDQHEILVENLKIRQGQMETSVKYLENLVQQQKAADKEEDEE